MRENINIAELLLKQNWYETTPEEDKIIQDWVNESEENKECYDRLKDTEWTLGEVGNYNKPDVNLAFYKVSLKIAEKRRNGYLKVLGIAAAIAATIIGVVFNLPFWSEKPASTDATIIAKGYEEDTLANAAFGESMLLVGSKRINLDEVNDGVIERNENLQIQKTGRLIEYQLMGTSHKLRDSVNTRLITGIASTYQVSLPDNSMIELSAASSLTIKTITKSEQRVELKGEAYFKITHDHNRKFTVMVNDIEIEDFGTEFNVNAFDAGGKVKTALIKGAVAMKYGNNKTTLLPGQVAIAEPGQPIKIENDGAIETIAWRKGEFAFNKDTITTVMRELSRWHDIQVLYIDTPRGVFSSSAISHKMPLDSILSIFEENRSARIKRNGKIVTVSAWKD